METVVTEQDPIDPLIAIEEASVAPIRPEFIEGTAVVPPTANDRDAAAYKDRQGRRGGDGHGRLHQGQVAPASASPQGPVRPSGRAPRASERR